MNKRIRVLVELEMHEDIKDFDEDTVKDALKHFGEYNDKILKIEEMKEWTEKILVTNAKKNTTQTI